MRNLLNRGYKLAERFPGIKTLVAAADSFLFQTSSVTKTGPHIRDYIDLKRWMMLVVFALFPCVLVAIWNSGLQSMVYSSGDKALMDSYLAASLSLSAYGAFAKTHFSSIVFTGLKTFIPVLLRWSASTKSRKDF
jgi:Na+-transporting NADH:ubiquinone oxidoreductase subunit B